MSSKSEVRQCWTIVWRMMSVEMARTAVGQTTIECCVRWCATRCAGSDTAVWRLLSLERQHGQLVVDALFNRQPVQCPKQRVDNNTIHRRRKCCENCKDILITVCCLFFSLRLVRTITAVKPTELVWQMTTTKLLSLSLCRMCFQCAARPLMLSPKRVRKGHDDRRRPTHHQPHQFDSSRLREPMRKQDDIRGSAQNLMGMVKQCIVTLTCIFIIT